MVPLGLRWADIWSTPGLVNEFDPLVDSPPQQLALALKHLDPVLLPLVLLHCVRQFLVQLRIALLILLQSYFLGDFDLSHLSNE